jgi:hypothetical protein
MLKSRPLMAVVFACTIPLHAGCPPNTPEQGNRPAGGHCPSDQVCSGPPNGLFFSGAQLGDQFSSETAPYAIAVGGTQNIKVWLDGGASQPFSAPLETPPDKAPWCTSIPPAFCAFPDGASAALSVDLPVPPVVTVVGKMAGTGTLRITDPFGMNMFSLYDLISLDVVAVSQMRVIGTSDLAFAFLQGPQVRDTPIAFAVGSMPPAVVVGMFAPLGSGAQRVVDESLVLNSLAGNLKQNQWDSLVPTGPFTQAQDYMITATTKGQPPVQVLLKVVDTASKMEVASGGVGVTVGKPLIPGKDNLVCFSSFASGSDGVQVFDMLIYGPKLSFEAKSNVKITAVNGPTGDSCIYMQPTSSGSPVVRVGYGMYHNLFAFDVAH